MTFLDKITSYLDTHLVEDWRKAYKMLSTQISTLVGTAAVIWPTLDASQQLAIMSALHISDPSTLVLIGVAAIIVGRLKAQSSVSGQ